MSPECLPSLSCPLRQQNTDYAMYLLTVLYHESWVSALHEFLTNQELKRTLCRHYPEAVHDPDHGLQPFAKRSLVIVIGSMILKSGWYSSTKGFEKVPHSLAAVSTNGLEGWSICESDHYSS